MFVVTVTVIHQTANFNLRRVISFDFGCWISIFLSTLKYLKTVYNPYIVFALLIMVINNFLTVIQLFFFFHKHFFFWQGWTFLWWLTFRISMEIWKVQQQNGCGRMIPDDFQGFNVPSQEELVQLMSCWKIRAIQYFIHLFTVVIKLGSLIKSH